MGEVATGSDMTAVGQLRTIDRGSRKDRLRLGADFTRGIRRIDKTIPLVGTSAFCLEAVWIVQRTALDSFRNVGGHKFRFVGRGAPKMGYWGRKAGH